MPLTEERNRTTLETPPLGRERKKPSGKEQQDRERARDKGTVTPLGVEVFTTIYEALKECRRAKKWSKRTLVEEALSRYLTEQGFPPAAQPEEGA